MKSNCDGPGRAHNSDPVSSLPREGMVSEPALLKAEVLKPENEKQFEPEHIRVVEFCNSEAHPDVSATLVRVDPGVTTALHWLDVDEIQYIISGSGRVELGGRQTEVGAGSEIRIPRGTQQRITNTGPDDLVFTCTCTPRFTAEMYHTLEDPVVRSPLRSGVIAVVPEFGNSRTDKHKGRVAIVTGASGGIGGELCRQLCMVGFTVVLTARDAKRGSQAAAALQQQGLNADFLQLDVSKPEDADRLAAHVGSQYGRVDVLVNCAGVNFDAPHAPGGGEGILDIRTELFHDTLEVNTLGPLRVTRALLPLMRATPGGARIVNISSDIASLADMDDMFPAYRMSKTALNAETRMLAAALKNTGIVANCVSPGWVKTSMGGPNAPDTLQQGAQAVLWLATTESPPTGGFFRRVSDRQPPEAMVEIASIPW